MKHGRVLFTPLMANSCESMPVVKNSRVTHAHVHPLDPVSPRWQCILRGQAVTCLCPPKLLNQSAMILSHLSLFAFVVRLRERGVSIVF